jgi:hypothetical protein
MCVCIYIDKIGPCGYHTATDYSNDYREHSEMELDPFFVRVENGHFISGYPETKLTRSLLSGRMGFVRSRSELVDDCI